MSLVYAIAGLAFVATYPDLRLRCLLSNRTFGEETAEEAVAGVRVAATPGLVDDFLDVPVPGDVLREVAGRPVRNFIDFARASGVAREGVSRDGRLGATDDPLELGESTALSLVQKDGEPFPRVKVRYWSREADAEKVRWLPAQALPGGRFALTLAWTVGEVLLILFAAVAYWRRPQDDTAGMFVLLCCCSLVAVVGGSHWWMLGASPTLAVPLIWAATLLPCLLVHFFLTFPRGGSALRNIGPTGLIGLYLPSVAAAALLTGTAVVGWAATGDAEPAAFGVFGDAFAGATVAKMLAAARTLVYAYASVSAVYFAGGLVLLWRSLGRTTVEPERRQLRWMLTAGLASVAGFAVVLWRSTDDRARFAFGEGQSAVYAATVLIAVAYAWGVLRARPDFFSQAASRGLRHAAATTAATLLVSFALATAAVLSVLKIGRGMPAERTAVLMTGVLTAAAVVAWWVRDRLQGLIDRRFSRERYRLDTAVRGIQGAADEFLEPDRLGERTLDSCRDAVRVRSAALYLREGDRFRLTVRGRDGDRSWSPPAEIPAADSLLSRLKEGTLLQQVPGFQNAVQDMLRAARADAVQPVPGRDGVSGLILLTGKHGDKPFTADDATFLAALGPMTGAAIESSRIHTDLGRLTEELRRRIDTIDRQQQQIRLLESELKQVEAAPFAEPAAAASSLDSDSTAPTPAVRGTSPAIRETLRTARKVAASEASVLIRGESGTGKELIARLIHDESPRREGPLVALHCAALTSSLLESELFGHVKGAFTDARSDRAGRIEQADGGTLFLDEVGDIPPDVQVKLLRVLQERVVERVGGSEARPVDVRIIAATHQNLEALIAAGRFREDLFYRLNVVSLSLPPLRDRSGDVTDLAIHFLRRSTSADGSPKRFSPEAAAALESYHWPGNVRQLQNVVERASVLAEGPVVSASDLPEEVREQTRSPFAPRKNAPPAASAPQAAPAVPDEPPELARLRTALAESGGNKAAAARAMGLPRSTFFSKLKKHGLA